MPSRPAAARRKRDPRPAIAVDDLQLRLLAVRGRWIYTGLLVAIGVALLIVAQVQSRAADPYRNARECPEATSPNCYQLSPGTIRSVSVSQTRHGERDTTVIDTRATSVTVVLEPSASEAAHVRTGAAVNVKWYQGKVTLVEVDGIGVPSIDNPAAQQSDFQFYGIATLVLGGVSALVPIWVRRRRARREAALAGGGESVAGMQQSLLPDGELGWIVRPALQIRAVAALGLGVGFLALTTLRVAGDPTRTDLAIAFDVVLLAVGVLVLLAYFRNSRVIASHKQITRIDWRGRSRTYPISEVLHVDRFRSGPNPYLIFAGRDGRQLFRVSGIYWDYKLLDRMCGELGLTLEGDFDDIVGSRSINKRARATSNWGATILAIGALIAVVTFYVWLLVGPTSR